MAFVSSLVLLDGKIKKIQIQILQIQIQIHDVRQKCEI